MTQEPRPWWFSGDEGPAARDSAAPDGAAPDGAEQAEPESQEAPQGAGALDWSGLVLGAQRLVDWATSTVMAPHAEHGDPREHPQCVVCRAMLLLADRPAATASDPVAEPEESDHAEPGEIDWIPILGESSGA